MARTTPRVEGSTLVGGGSDAGPITIGSLAWFAWLEQATTFAVATADGSFTARKERSTRAGGYWKAYRKRAGKLQSAYMGKSADLTLEHLHAVAANLASSAAPRHLPAHGVADATALVAEPIRRTALPTGTVTFLCTNIEGSTQLWEQHKEAMPIALAAYDLIVRAAIQAHQGVVFKTVGESVHAVFARAGDAVAAALAILQGLQAQVWGATGPLRVCMALHSGVAEERDGDYFGLALNRLARTLALGHGGQVLLTRATHDLAADDLPPNASLRDLGEQHLKGLSRPEQIFQLLSPDLPDAFPALRTADERPVPHTPALPLLTTKLYVPPARANLVARPHLIERLQAGLHSTLTLICAPAGFGKTTLLVQGLEASGLGRGGSLPAPLVAWVSLDSADRDPARFWSYVLTALDSLHPGGAADALPALQFVPAPPIEGLLTQVLNALTALPADAVLVLDDYHVIDSTPIHTAVAFLLDHLPPRLHLVITTRADPPLPLARLRARGMLTELRAADLRFTPDKVAAFLTTIMGLPLAPSEVAALEARTEGWIAGLQLAALAMRDRADHASFVAAFTGSNRFVVDYLAAEVLEHLPGYLQRFVLQTSTLERFCGPLCDAVLGVGGWDVGVAERAPLPHPQSLSADAAYSQPLLQELERINLFVIPLDDERRWYRYHHLFAEELRERLQSGAARSEVLAIHRRASAWFAHNELWSEAIQHALAAQDWMRAADVIEQHGRSTLFRGRVHTVIGWMTMLPEPLVRARPGLCVLHALTCMFTNDLRAAEARLQQAEEWIQAHAHDSQARTIRGWVATIQASIFRMRGDLASCVDLSRQTLDLLPETELIGAAARVNLVHGYLVSGDVRLANERLVTQAVAIARASGNLISILRSLTLLARLQVLQGHLKAAAVTYAEAAQVAPGHDGLQALVNSAAYYVGMGDLLRERNDLATAESYLARGMDHIRGTLTVDAHVVWRGYLAEARLQQSFGNMSGALATLDQFEQLAYQRGYFSMLVKRAAAMRARLWLIHGNIDVAMRWLEQSGLHPDDDVSFPREGEYMTLVRLLIAQRLAEPALGLLERLLHTAEAGERMHSVIEILTIRALAWQARGQAHSALADLERALVLAAPEGTSAALWTKERRWQRCCSRSRRASRRSQHTRQPCWTPSPTNTSRQADKETISLPVHLIVLPPCPAVARSPCPWPSR